MGKVADYYKELLMKALFGANYVQLRRMGKLPPVDAQKMEKAIQAVWKKIDEEGPDLRNPKKSFKTQLAKERDPKLYQKFGYNEASQQNMGTGNTPEQYRKNRSLLMKYVILPSVQRDIEWSKAVNRLGLKGERNNAVQNLPNRWVKTLMRTDGTKESLVFNTEVMALAALCQRRITPEEFKSVRMNHYMDEFVQGRIGSLEEARRKVDEEVQNAPKRILQIVRDEIQKGRELAPSLPGIGYHVLHGTMNDPRVGRTEDSCFRALSDTGVLTAWAAKDIQKMLKDYGVPDDQNLSEAEVAEGQVIGASTDVPALSELVANPYYAVYDPFKIYEETGTSIQRENDLTKPGARLKNTYLDCLIHAPFAVAEAARDTLGKYAIDADMQVKTARVGDLHVFRQADVNGGFRTSIQRVHGMEHQQIFHMEEVKPEVLFGIGLEKATGTLVQKIAKWSEKSHTSDEFERMREALNNMDQKILPENANAAAYDDMQETLQTLLDRTNEYLAKKTAEKAVRGRFKSSYERKRVEFAKEVKTYAEKKLEQLGYCREAFDTMEKAAAAERAYANTPERFSDPRYVGRSALAYKVMKDEEAAAVRRAEERRREEEENRRQQAAEKAQQTEIGKGYRRQFDEIGKGIAAPGNRDQAAATEKVSAFCEEKKQGYRASLNNPAAFEEATKKYLAAKTVENYLKLEREQQEPKDWTMHELVNAGKINELTDFVMHTDLFREKLPSMNPFKKEEKLEDMLTHRSTHLVAKGIKECLTLANEAHQVNEDHRVLVGIRKLEADLAAEKDIQPKAGRFSVTGRMKEKTEKKENLQKEELVPQAMGRRSLQKKG